jgi:AcrR family transcriptional regulator
VDTKQEILNTAEVLFARSGYRASSMRAITEKAGVNLALVNYHFGSKEALLEAVISRRLGPVNKLRLKRLREVRNRCKERKIRPSAEDILRAFIEPVFGSDETRRGWADVITLIGRAYTEPDDIVQTIVLRHMRPVTELMLELLGLALPGVPSEEVFWRYQFVIGALGRAIRMNAGPGYEPLKKNAGADSATMTRMLITFASGGMRAGGRGEGK